MQVTLAHLPEGAQSFTTIELRATTWARSGKAASPAWRWRSIWGGPRRSGMPWSRRGQRPQAGAVSLYADDPVAEAVNASSRFWIFDLLPVGPAPICSRTLWQVAVLAPPVAGLSVAAAAPILAILPVDRGSHFLHCLVASCCDGSDIHLRQANGSGGSAIGSMRSAQNCRKIAQSGS